MKFVQPVEAFLLALAYRVPLVLFVIIGSLLEEVVAPIPSPLIGMTAGTITQAQQKGLLFLLLIGLISAASKTLGCLLFYFLADKAEDFVTQKFGKILGFSHKDIECIGSLFSKTAKDDLILAAIRAIPIMPTTPVSLACGFIKMDIISFLRASFIGNFIRGMLFLYIGYSGLGIFQSMIGGINKIESWMNIIIVMFLIGFLAFVYYKRGKSDFRQWFNRKKAE